MTSKPTLICVAICERSVSAIENAIKEAEVAADLVEIRVDCLDSPNFDELRRLSAGVKKPTIVTFRPAEQGGLKALTRDERINFWSAYNFDNAVYRDVENDIIDAIPFASEKRLICSHHDYSAPPVDVDTLYQRLTQTSAEITKIAVHADDVIDCLPIFRLLDRAVKDNRKLIAIAMGTAGVATRILGPSRGAYLTYASSDDESGTAPGQLRVQELRETYRIDQIDRNTAIFGVVGLPANHSLSPVIHNAGFQEVHYDGVYVPFEVRDVSAFMKRMVHPRTRELDWNMRGLSVTTPHKVAVMDHLDWIEPHAKEIGAVNTIVVNDDRVNGYNTDADGFLDGLRTKLDVVEGMRCAVIGTGGAARAAVWALRKASANVTVISRDQTRAEAFASNFDVTGGALASTSFNGFNVVVNATSLGNVGEFQNHTPASAAQLRGARIAYDLVYNPIETRFLREAREAGCETISGLEMFIAQAVRQFELWTGKAPPRRLMRSVAEKELNKRLT